MSASTTDTTRFVLSNDGTRIAYDRSGEGPPLLVIGGLLCDRQRTRPLAEAFSRFATVVNVDRRGRGDSGSTAAYAVDREIDDLAAVIQAHGGRAALYGHSSGAGLALHAAARGLPLTRLILHEPPFGDDDPASTSGARGLAEQVLAALAEDRRGDAVEIFLSAAGVPPDLVAAMRSDPRVLAMAPTMRHDIAVMGEIERGGTIPEPAARGVQVRTLVVAGGASPGFFRDTAVRLARLIPNARYRELPGESHDAAPAAVARAVQPFVTR
jgi:pimeloyl-ACP methyl ester carboxylesterase